MQKETNTLNVLNYPVYKLDLNQLNGTKKLLINTINQYSFCIAEKDTKFKEALLQSDVLLPDGIGIVAAAKFINKEKITKIAGADLHAYFLEKLDKESGSCFYMGSSESTLVKIKKRLHKEFPNIKVGTYSPPFKPEFNTEDNTAILEAVNSFSPDVLFVAMTAPKQEKWSYQFKNELNTQYICSIGAVFDFYAGTITRPSKFWQNLGLEWLGRLLKEPKRMWKRYIYYGFVFAGHLVKHKFKKN
ncbi:WecB/TagA/CpsF family glycosyltransferase [Zobellia uliginosa]|uniref:WecB/TagA/CpsF family glycosyltransferase n=1 Tax=Zobellia uliginosa TaxID=143224 RepID=UPI001C069D4F|nr:WecB/TagA/CpsF family glycosyltransferase [Zobellia uliginosa]MBU2947841.1 WecB/TagA/CpsF family glycosyltransferase [Zobellia uliginosa]